MMMNQFTQPAYQQQLNQKIQNFTELMAEYSPPQVSVFTSPISHYRMRAEFRIWHEGNELYHIMFKQGTKERIRIDQFPIASELINQAMSIIIPELKKQMILRYKLFQIDYLSTLSGQLLITLNYHKKLDEEWTDAAKQLREFFTQHGFDVQLIGRATKQKICLDNDYIDEKLVIAGQELVYRQVEGSFTQPNAQINIKMLEWALDVTKEAKHDLLELYCGNGNFSLALARNFEHVLATEISKASVKAAQYNIEVNDINNVTIARMSAEEFTQALQGVREFNRLKGINLSEYNCQTVLVDPPRAGLDLDTIKMIQAYPQIIYISCNPLTLKDNLKELTLTHTIKKIALFDQFPYTHHIECALLLKQR